MEYTVEVDKETCLSTGQCVLDEPEAFVFDDDELAEPVEGAALPEDRLRAVARGCPSGAIKLSPRS